MGWIGLIIAVIVIIYNLCRDWSFDNCAADNVDWSRMSREEHLHTRAEQERLYKSGYYNKKK